MKKIIEQARAACIEICEKAKLNKGDILIVGCSTSEVTGGIIGHNSSAETGEILFKTINDILTEKGIYLAAQCCEHLNRAIIIEKDALYSGAETVNVMPQPKAGGSFATAAYKGFRNPVAVETIKADAGIDIGDTLIGMHLKSVAVPVRLENNSIGSARVIAARTREKFIGGERAHYNSDLF